MKLVEYYKRKLKNKPDLLTTKQAQKISELTHIQFWTAIKNGNLQTIFYRNTIRYIPKSFLIQFLISDYYDSLRGGF